MTEIEKLKDAIRELALLKHIVVPNETWDEERISRYREAVRLLVDFARIAVESEWKFPSPISPNNEEEYRKDEWWGYGVNETLKSCLAAHTAILAEERSKSLPSKEELQAIIQDINFESYGFSHEEVAVKTAEAIHSAMLKKRGE